MKSTTSVHDSRMKEDFNEREGLTLPVDKEKHRQKVRSVNAVYAAHTMQILSLLLLFRQSLAIHKVQHIVSRPPADRLLIICGGQGSLRCQTRVIAQRVEAAAVVILVGSVPGLKMVRAGVCWSNARANTTRVPF